MVSQPMADAAPTSAGCRRRPAAYIFVAIARDYIDNAAIDYDLCVFHAMALTAPPSV
jgi:hypothetical protein